MVVEFSRSPGPQHLSIEGSNRLPSRGDLEVSLDPCAFNGGETQAGLPLLSQNVEVLTPAFTTVIPKFLDLSEATEVFEEAKDLRKKDDPEVILDRKLNKILLRLRFRKVGEGASEGSGAGAWLFFLRLTMKFSVRFSAEEVKAHDVDLVLCLKSV